MTSNKNFPLLIMFTILCVSCSIQPGRVLTEFTTDPNRTKTVGRVCKGTSRS